MPKTYRGTDATLVDHLMYAHFIPFKELTPILEPFINLHPPVINVFIDLYSMTTPLYRAYNYENPITLTACIANAAIHYRNFFRQAGIYANIFLVYSPTMSQNNLMYCPEYNKEHIMERANNYEVKKLIDNNLELFGTIVPYMPNVFLRLGTVEVSIMITDMLMQFIAKKYNVPTLVVSSSPVSFQIPTLIPTAVVLYRTRTRELYLVDSKNALGTAIKYNKKVEADISDIDPSWISGYYTYVGMSKRSMSPLLDYRMALNCLRSIKYNNEVLSSESLINAYMNSTTSKPKTDEVKTLIHNRFNCFDFRNQLIMYQLMPESKETAYLTQINNMEELYRLNDKYFRHTMMQLDKL